MSWQVQTFERSKVNNVPTFERSNVLTFQQLAKGGHDFLGEEAQRVQVYHIIEVGDEVFCSGVDKLVVERDCLFRGADKVLCLEFLRGDLPLGIAALVRPGLCGGFLGSLAGQEQIGKYLG